MTNTNTKNYTCKETKGEIINAIVEQFEKINREYDKALKSGDSVFQEQAFGKYQAMIELLQKVKIYEN